MLGSTYSTRNTGPGRPTRRPDDLDVSGRPLYSAVPDLDRLFRPGTVAVIGASDAEGRPNTGITRQLLAWSERVGARLFPVNPGRKAVFGLPCHTSVSDLVVVGRVDDLGCADNGEPLLFHKGRFGRFTP